MTENSSNKLENEYMYDSLLSIYESTRKDKVKTVYRLNIFEKILWYAFPAWFFISLAIWFYCKQIVPWTILGLAVIGLLIIVIDKAFSYNTKRIDDFDCSWYEMLRLNKALKDLGVDVNNEEVLNKIISVYKDRLNNPDKRFELKGSKAFLPGIIGGLIVLIPTSLLDFVKTEKIDFIIFTELVVGMIISVCGISFLLDSIKNTFIDNSYRTFITTKLIERLIDLRDFDKTMELNTHFDIADKYFKKS